MALIIGLTGGIGSGKTTVAQFFTQLGIDIIDTDEIAHHLVKPNTPALKKIIKKFGSTMLMHTGDLNRSKLAKLIFSNPEQKKWLENLLHPLIWRTVKQQLTQTTSPYVIIVVPLLIESNLHKEVDRILIVDTNEKNQLERSTLRNPTNNPADIKKIIASQCSRKERLAYADDIIYNESVADTKEQVQALHNKYCALI